MSSASYAHWIEKEKENPESEYASLKNMEDGQIVQSDKYSFLKSRKFWSKITFNYCYISDFVGNHSTEV